MLITRCKPRHEIDRFFKGFDLPGFSEFFETGETGERVVTRIPRTNIRETDSEYLFSLEMPGIDKSQVEVSVEGDRLLIKGDATTETEDKALIQREFRSVRFERSFGLGTDVDTENVRAVMDNGVVTVTVPRKSDKVGRKIDVA